MVKQKIPKMLSLAQTERARNDNLFGKVTLLRLTRIELVALVLCSVTASMYVVVLSCAVVAEKL